MIEVATLLNHTTNRSLLVLDKSDLYTSIPLTPSSSKPVLNRTIAKCRSVDYNLALFGA